MKKILFVSLVILNIILSGYVLWYFHGMYEIHSQEIDSRIAGLKSTVTIENDITTAFFRFTSNSVNKSFALANKAIRDDHNKSIESLKSCMQELETVKDNERRMFTMLSGSFLIVVLSMLILMGILLFQMRKIKKTRKRTVKK